MRFLDIEIVIYILTQLQCCWLDSVCTAWSLGYYSFRPLPGFLYRPHSRWPASYFVCAHHCYYCLYWYFYRNGRPVWKKNLKPTAFPITNFFERYQVHRLYVSIISYLVAINLYFTETHWSSLLMQAMGSRLPTFVVPMSTILPTMDFGVKKVIVFLHFAALQESTSALLPLLSVLLWSPMSSTMAAPISGILTSLSRTTRPWSWPFLDLTWSASDLC